MYQISAISACRDPHINISAIEKRRISRLDGPEPEDRLVALDNLTGIPWPSL